MTKPSQKLEHYQLQKDLFQEGSDEESWDEDDEEADVLWQPREEPRKKKCVVPEKEEVNEGEYRIVKDNQLWEKQNRNKGEDEDMGLEEEAHTDGTMEKGLGQTDALIRSGNPHSFQPYTMEILKTDEQKADWQDKDRTIALVKTWLKEKERQ